MPINMPTIDLDIFAQINADHAIKNTRNLEGLSSQKAVSFLLQFIKDKGAFLEQSIQNPQFSQEWHIFTQKLQGLQLTWEQFNHITTAFAAQLNQPLDSYDLEGIITKNLQRHALPIVGRILRLDAGDLKTNSVLMPGGWSATPPLGHAIAYEFQKDQDGNLLFFLYNSGAGLSEFHKKIPDLDKLRYETMQVYRIPKKDVVVSNLQFLVAELLKPMVLPGILPSLVSTLTYSLPEHYKDYDAKTLYQRVLKSIHHLHGEIIEPAAHLSTGQRSGSCAKKSLDELLKHSLTNPQFAKLVLLVLKVYSIERLLSHSNPSQRNTKERTLLAWAGENLARNLLKQQAIPTQIFIEARAIVMQVEALNQVAVPPRSHDQSLHKLNSQAVYHDSYHFSFQHYRDKPTNSQPTSVTIIEKKWFQKEVDWYQKAIALAQFSMEKMVAFKEIIEKRMLDGAYPVIERQIIGFLTQMPLTESYFKTIHTAEEARTFLKVLCEILVLYRQIGEKKGRDALNPESAVVILSVLEAIDLVCRNLSIPIMPDGINIFFLSPYNYSHNTTFDLFKSASTHNPWFATNNLALDKRLKEIIASKRVPSQDHRSSDQRRITPTLAAITTYLSEPENVSLKTYLQTLYEARSQKESFLCSVQGEPRPFDNETHDALRKKDLAAAAAYLQFLHPTQPHAFQKEAQEILFIKETAAVIELILSTLKTHSMQEWSAKRFQPNDTKKYFGATKEPATGTFNFRDVTYLSDFTGFNQGETLSYFKKIKKEGIKDSLSADFFISDRKTANDIFAIRPSPGLSETETQDKHRIYQELKHLRLVPELQFLATIAYFSEHLDFFSAKIRGEDWQSDMEIYLRRNIFEPGILIQALEDNPECLTQFHHFIATALLHFRRDGHSSLYFYQLQSDVNRYALSFEPMPRMDEDEIATLERMKERLWRIQQESLNTLETRAFHGMTPEDRYHLTKITLELYIECRLGRGPTYTKKLLHLFLSFSKASREPMKRCSQEERDRHEKLTETCLQHLSQSETHIYAWALELWSPDTSNTYQDLIQEARFPYFYGKDAKGQTIISIDLTSGNILIAGKSQTYPPNEMLHSSLCQAALRGRTPNLSISIGGGSYQAIITQYEFEKSKPGERLLKLEEGSQKTWIYQKEISVNQSVAWYEQQFFADARTFAKFTLSPSPNQYHSKAIGIALPESFHGRETRFWQALDKDEVFIENGEKRFLLKQPFQYLEELDANNQATGLILTLDKKGSLPFMEFFSRFEHPEFIQILCEKPDHSQTPLTQTLIIYFPRYALELIGVFDKKAHLWVFHIKDQPHLILLDDSKIITKPYAPNSLLFYNKNTQEKRVYQPNQSFYVDTEAEKSLAEDQFETLYHRPILDTDNRHKRALLQLEHSLNSLYFPIGLATYSHSERYFVYTVLASSQELVAASSEAQLYLVYLNLIHIQPEAAFAALLRLKQTGGLKGTADELAIIDRIMTQAPGLVAQIDNPAFIAVKVTLLSLCLALETNGFSIAPVTKDPATTPDEAIQKAQLERLQTFEQSLPQLALDCLEKYDSTRANVPDALRLPDEALHQMMLTSAVSTKGSIPLKARQLALKRHFLISEQQNILHQKSVKPLSANQLKRLDAIDAYLAVQREETFLVKSIHSVELSIPVSISPPYIDESFNRLNDLRSSIKTYQANAPLDLHPAMTDKEFLKQLKAIFEASRNPAHSCHARLQDFLENTLRAHSLITQEDKKSRIARFAPTLLVIMKHPTEFKANLAIDNHTLFFKEIFKQAHDLSPCLPISLIEPIETPISIDISPRIKADESYSRPEPMAITAGAFCYTPFAEDSFLDKIGLTEIAEQYKEYQAQNLQKTLRLKCNFELQTRNKPFAETMALRHHYEKQIGCLKIEEQAYFQTTVQAALSPEVLTSISTLTTAHCKRLTTNYLAMERQALVFANKGPSDPALLTQFQLARAGKKRTDLTLPDLNHLFILADWNEYRKVTGLHDEDIAILHETMSHAIQFSILKTRYEKIKQNLDEPNITQLTLALFAKNHVSIQDTATQFFQKEEGILLRPGQVFCLNKLLSQDNIVIQAGMGDGKSKVLGPLRALKKANGSNLVIHQVPSDLLDINYADACNKSMRLFNRKPFLLTFERRPMNFQCTKGFSKKPLSTVFEELYESLSICVATKNYVMTSGDALKAMRLQFFDTLRQRPADPKSPAFQEWSKQVRVLSQILKLFKEKGARLIDEVHEELDPIKKLNFIVGEPKSISKESISLCSNFFFFINQIDVAKILNKGVKTTFFNLIRDNTLISDPDTQMNALMKTIADHLLAAENQNHPSNPLRQILPKLGLDKTQQTALMAYLLNRNESIKPFLERKLNKADLEAISFLKLELSHILPFTLLQTYNKDYGPSMKPLLNAFQKKVAIPYGGIGTPLEEDRFGQFEVALNLTMQMTIRQPLSREMVIQLIEGYLDAVREELTVSHHANLDDTLVGTQFYEHLGQYFGMTLSTVSELAESQSESQSQAFEAFVEKARHSDSFKKAVLEEKIAPLVQFNPLVYSCNSHDLFDMTHTTEGMSGTPVNHRAYRSRLKFDELENLGTDGETLYLLEKKNTQVLMCPKAHSVEHLLEQAIVARAGAGNLNAIMDVGGLFVDEPSNLAVAKKIANYYKTHTEKRSTPIRYVIFFDNETKCLSALDTTSHTIISLDNKSDEKDIYAKLQCPPAERFTYYDQVRTTGTDITQADNAHALVTISENTTQSNLLQGVKRFRQFHANQSVTLIAPHYLSDRIQARLDSVLHFVQKNQNEQLCREVHFNGALEEFKTILKSDLLTHIYSLEDPVEQSELFALIASLFSEEFKINYFANYGSIDTSEPATSYFLTLSETYYKNWLSLRNLIRKAPSTGEDTAIKGQLKAVKQRAVQICNPVITQQKSALGLTVQLAAELRTTQDDTLQTTLQNKLKNKTLTQVEPQSANPNNLNPLEIATLDTPLLIQEGYALSCISANAGLFPGIRFDPNILISQQQARTNNDWLKTAHPKSMISNSFYGSKLRLAKRELTSLGNYSLPKPTRDILLPSNYHNQYIKPIHAIMMTASKTNPNDTLQAILLSQSEMNYYTHLGRKGLEKKYPNHYVWFTSPSETIPYSCPLLGTPPKMPPPNYQRTLEQIRFINGNVKELAHQTEGFSWLAEVTTKKMAFLEKTVMPHFSEKDKCYPVLVSRLKTEGLYAPMEESPGGILAATLVPEISQARGVTSPSKAIPKIRKNPIDPKNLIDPFNGAFSSNYPRKLFDEEFDAGAESKQEKKTAPDKKVKVKKDRTTEWRAFIKSLSSLH